MKAHRLWILLAILLAPSTGYAQIYRLAEMNADQVRALDHEKAVILIPGGILEEHGPYLPVYTDGYANRYYTQKLANAIAARPGWKVVIFPEIPLAFGGANNIGAKWDFPGTYTVRLSTLRSVYMDLAGDLGAQKFRWVFAVHDHGDPAHNQALAQASDYFQDTIAITKFGTGRDASYFTENAPEIVNAANGKAGVGATFDYSKALGDFEALQPGALTAPVVWKMKLVDPLKSPDVHISASGMVDK